MAGQQVRSEDGFKKVNSKKKNAARKRSRSREAGLASTSAPTITLPSSTQSGQANGAQSGTASKPPPEANARQQQRRPSQSPSPSPSSATSPQIYIQHQPPPLPISNLNSAELKNFLNFRWAESINQVNDTTIPEEKKPQRYRSPEKAWSNKGALTSSWAQKPAAMANGSDFLVEISKHFRPSSPTRQPEVQQSGRS